jgi:ribosomal protein L11 methyltransferase
MPADLRLTVIFPTAGVAAARGFLAEHAVAPEHLDEDPGGAARLVAYLPEDRAVACMEGLRAVFVALRAAGELRGSATFDLDDDDRAWAGGRTHVRVRPCFVILPPEGDQAQLEPGEIALPLETEGAFGDGRHPSTALCLTEMAALADYGAPVQSVLDVGCGTGVLSVAAARLWPQARVTAIDIAPAAVALTRRNAERLGLAGRIAAAEGSLQAATGRYDVVLANLSARPLQQLDAALVARVARGGALVIAGFRGDGTAPLARRYAMRGLVEAAATEERGWGVVRLTAPAK